jgi:branched-chain amino acid transport system substrate-binding protein
MQKMARAFQPEQTCFLAQSRFCRREKIIKRIPVMFRKLAVLFLFVALLPACAGLQFPAQNAPKVTKPTAAALFQDAEASYHRQAYRQAYQQYAYYLELYPHGSRAMDARLKAAEILGLLGNWQDSLKHYQAILALKPSEDVSLKARYGVGWAYFKLGDYARSSQVLENLTAAPDLSRSLWFSTQALMTEIALKKGQVRQAFAHLRLAEQNLSSGDPEWFADLKSRLLKQATVPDLEQLANLYRDNPLSAALLLHLARLAQDSGKPDVAEKWLATLKERFPNSPETAAAQRLLAGNKIEVGCLLPLTGRFSDIGFRVQRGMDLAAHKTSLELLYRDTATNPATAAELTQKLAQDPNVLAIIGPLSSTVAQSAAQAAQNASISLIGLSQKDGLTQTGNLIFQAFLTPRQQVHALVSYAMSKGIKRFAIFYPDSPYGNTFSQDFQNEVSAAGGELAGQASYNPSSQEFGSTLAALASSLKPAPAGTPENLALFIPDDAATVAAIAAAMNVSPLKGTQLLGTNLLHHANLGQPQMTAMEGIVFPDAFFAGDPNPAVQKFVAAYQQKYGTKPDYLAAQGYVVLRLMARLAEHRQALSRTSLPQQLQALKPTPDLPWFKGFNAQRQEIPEIYLLTFTNGGLQEVPPASETAPAQ